MKIGFNGCGSNLGYIYLVSFNIFYTLIAINLFLAIVWESYEISSLNEDSVVKPIDIYMF